MTAPPFAYFGGKTRLADRIVELLPPHEHYVEPYAGSLAVLLAKPRSLMETVNDLDGDLMTFWRVLRDRPDELAEACALTPHSRAEHFEAYDLDAAPTEVERARRVWTLLSQGRGRQMKPTGWRHYVDPAGSVTSMPGYLEAYVGRIAPAAARLAGVSLECQPALQIIERYGYSRKVLLYVDPPYLGSTRLSGGYRHEMKTEAERRRGVVINVAESTTMTRKKPAPCAGCGHSKRNHIKGTGLCLVRSCRLCLFYRASNLIEPPAAAPLFTDEEATSA